MHTATILTAVAVAAVNINAVLAECAHNNLIRCLIGHQEPAISFCSSAVGIFPTASTLTVTTTATPIKATTTDTASQTRTVRPLRRDLARRADDGLLPCATRNAPLPAQLSSACSCFSREATLAPVTTTTTVTAPGGPFTTVIIGRDGGGRPAAG